MQPTVEREHQPGEKREGEDLARVRVARDHQSDALGRDVLCAHRAVVDEDRRHVALQGKAGQNRLDRAFVVGRVHVEGVLVRIHVVEPDELEPVGQDDLVVQDSDAVRGDQLERALRVDVLLMVASHEEGRRDESGQRLQDAGLERRLGVDEIAGNEHEIRLPAVGLLDDPLQVRAPSVMAEMQVGDLHHRQLALEPEQPDLGLRDREGVGPQGA